MHRGRFVGLSLVAFALVVLGFVVRGLTRVAIGAETANLVALPLVGGGFVLIAVLAVLSALAYLGRGPLRAPGADNG